MGDARRLGVGQQQKRGCRSPGKLFCQGPYDWSQGMCTRRIIEWMLTHFKVDWYTDFYYPFLKRWTDRARKVMSNDKMFFVEPIPNEACCATYLFYFLTTFAVLSTIMDSRTSTSQYGVYPTLVGELLPQQHIAYLCYRYDLNVLFNKAFGDFTVNVQGLSRV
jgi:hypothetical protein